MRAVVDGPDGGVGVRVGSEQDAFGVRIELLCGLFQKEDAAHLRHALVDEHERHRVAALLETAEEVERTRHPIPAAMTR